MSRGPFRARHPADSLQEVSMSHHSDLIDTTEMYLRTVFELEEEGVVPLRARIAERLSQSGPTVSQTVARMERDGLVHVAGDRHLELTDTGRREAVAVMRKHRLAERLLADVIGLDWEDLHIEACRWEHVMSDKVERRIVALLTKPLVCPHGNPIPGLDQLGLPFATSDAGHVLVTLTDAAITHAAQTAAAAQAAGADSALPDSIVIDRISEQLQSDAALMHRLDEAGVRPGRPVRAVPVAGGVSVQVTDGEQPELFDRQVSDHVFVRTG
jgi:DtxR family Mn-dependent transcriptional regulator